MTTPNIGLTQPVPGVGGTPGPQWASEINSDLELLDEHDHAPGRGVAVTPAGLNINADLEFNTHDAASIRGAKFVTQVSDLATFSTVFVKNGELTFIDGVGNVVALTAAGSVAGATGSISGLVSPASAVYSPVSKSFTWSFDSSKPARMANADIIMYPYDGVTAFVNTITLKVPTAIAAAYSLTLPAAVPTNPNVLSMSGAGALSTGMADGTAVNPGASFTSELGTGLYRLGAGQLGFATVGVGRFFIQGGQFLGLSLGTVTAPTFSWNGDANTGIYSPGADSIGLTTGGTARLTLSNTLALFSEIIQTANGTAGAPAFSFSGDSNTGIYRDAADVLAISAGGSAQLRLGGGQLRAENGTAADPTFTFQSDQDIGLYRIGANQLGLSIAGTLQASLGAEGLSVGNTSASTGQRVMWALFEGTLAASANALLTPTGATEVYGAMGYSTYNGNGSGDWQVMRTQATGEVSSTTQAIMFGAAALPGTSSAVRIINIDTNSTNAYRLVVFYR